MLNSKSLIQFVPKLARSPTRNTHLVPRQDGNVSGTNFLFKPESIIETFVRGSPLCPDYIQSHAMQTSLDEQTSMATIPNTTETAFDLMTILAKRIRAGQSKVAQASPRVRQPLLFALPPKERSNGTIGLSSSGSIEAATRMNIAFAKL